MTDSPPPAPDEIIPPFAVLAWGLILLTCAVCCFGKLVASTGRGIGVDYLKE